MKYLVVIGLIALSTSAYAADKEWFLSFIAGANSQAVYVNSSQCMAYIDFVKSLRELGSNMTAVCISPEGARYQASPVKVK